MAEVALEPEEDIEEYARQKALEIRRPIPGQSLTNDPEQPWPWEGQPRFTDMNDALEYFFDKFTEEELFEDLMDLLEDGVPVMSLVEIFLQQGFQEGLFNPDLMLLSIFEKSGFSKSIPYADITALLYFFFLFGSVCLL